MNINGRDNQQYSVTLVTCSSTRGRWVKVGPSDMASQWNYTDEDLQDNTFQVITDAETDMIRNLDAVDYMVCTRHIGLAINCKEKRVAPSIYFVVPCYL